MQDAAALISDQVINGVFPIRILKVTGAEVILNQGGIRTSPGEQFTVFSEGEELKDPDTNETLGAPETPIASIRIDRVDSKLSYGTVTTGDPGKIVPEHAICRRAAPPPAP